MELDFSPFAALRGELSRLARALLRGSRVAMTDDDLVQATYARIQGGLARGTLHADAIASPRHFAYTILRNLFLDEVRRAGYQRERLTDDGELRDDPARAPAPPHPADRIALDRALSGLAPAERAFLLRVVVEGEGVEAAQRACGWPPASPYYHLRQILLRLRRGIEPDEPAAGEDP